MVLGLPLGRFCWCVPCVGYAFFLGPLDLGLGKQEYWRVRPSTSVISTTRIDELPFRLLLFNPDRLTRSPQPAGPRLTPRSKAPALPQISACCPPAPAAKKHTQKLALQKRVTLPLRPRWLSSRFLGRSQDGEPFYSLNTPPLPRDEILVHPAERKALRGENLELANLAMVAVCMVVVDPCRRLWTPGSPASCPPITLVYLCVLPFPKPMPRPHRNLFFAHAAAAASAAAYI